VFFEFILHGGATNTTGTSVLFGLPIVAGVVAALLTMAAVRLAGWRAGFAAAALGAVLLGSGLIGDVVSHTGHERERHEILDRMMEAPSAAAAHRLMELDSAEAQNVWHVASAVGQGLLVAGLAGAAFVLWYRNRITLAERERTSAPLRRAA
jgi:ribulose 1,5-bisphosphate synthetase/thiazole synthase